MIYTLDNTLFPSYLITQIFTHLTVGDVIWATRELALRKRTVQKKGSVGIIPFISFYRSTPVERDAAGQSADLRYNFKYVGNTAQQRQFNALRTNFTYDCVYYDYRADNIIIYEKKLVMGLWRAWAGTFSTNDLDVGYRFKMTTADVAASWHTEEIYNRGYINEYGFQITVEAFLLDAAVSSGLINSIDLNIYGYTLPIDVDNLPTASGSGAIPGMPETIVIV